MNKYLENILLFLAFFMLLILCFFAVHAVYAAERPMTREELKSIGLPPNPIVAQEGDPSLDELDEMPPPDKPKDQALPENVVAADHPEVKRLPFCKKVTRLCVPRPRGACFCRANR